VAQALKVRELLLTLTFFMFASEHHLVIRCEFANEACCVDEVVTLQHLWTAAVMTPHVGFHK
jgi:hypothetical protein